MSQSPPSKKDAPEDSSELPSAVPVSGSEILEASRPTSTEPLLAGAIPQSNWQPEKRHHRLTRHSVPSDASQAGPPRPSASSRPVSPPKQGYLPVELDYSLSDRKDHPAPHHHTTGINWTKFRVRMCLAVVIIVFILLTTFILFMYLRPHAPTFPLDDHAPFLVRLMERLSKSPSAITPGTIVVDLDRLASNFMNLLSHVGNNTAIQTTAVPSFPLLKHMLSSLRSHTVVVANIAHLQPVVSERLNVLYRGPSVVEIAIDSAIPSLVAWVVDSQEQLDTLKTASQKLFVRYRVVVEVDAGSGHGFQLGDQMDKAVQTLSDNKHFQVVGLYGDSDFVIQRPANEFWQGRQAAIMNSHDTYLRKLQEIYDKVAPTFGNITVYGSSVSQASLNSSVPITYQLTHVFGRCVFKSAKCDELTTQQLHPAEFVIGIVSREIKRERGWFNWLISQIDSSNFYEISTGRVSHTNLEAVYPASLSYHEGATWKMPSKLVLVPGDFVMYRMKEAVEAPVMAHSTGDFQLWSSR